jgi:molybdenum cofactor cytidylyltransferase
MRAELAGLEVELVVNPRWQDGLSTSIDVALTLLEATAGVDAVLFTTCDQPQVSPELLRELIGMYAARRAPIVACAYAGTVGVPALFDRSLFQELRALRGDAGAKRVIERHLAAVASVAFPDGALDIDTADDARRLASRPGEL